MKRTLFAAALACLLAACGNHEAAQQQSQEPASKPIASAATKIDFTPCSSDCHSLVPGGPGYAAPASDADADSVGDANRNTDQSTETDGQKANDAAIASADATAPVMPDSRAIEGEARHAPVARWWIWQEVLGRGCEEIDGTPAENRHRMSDTDERDPLVTATKLVDDYTLTYTHAGGQYTIYSSSGKLCEDARKSIIAQINQ
jgi:hypothetical protein